MPKAVKLGGLFVAASDVTLYEIRRLARRCSSREFLLLVHFSIALKEEITAL
jgi:hypothetical protein